MKANELMIGDLVRKLEPGGHTIPVKVTGIIDQDSSVLYERRDGVHGVTDLNAFGPIPLTAEILEKNGMIDRFETETYVTYSKHDETYYFCCYIAFCNMKLSICYVHELQHALRLCDIEKDIEL